MLMGLLLGAGWASGGVARILWRQKDGDCGEGRGQERPAGVVSGERWLASCPVGQSPTSGLAAALPVWVLDGASPSPSSQAGRRCPGACLLVWAAGGDSDSQPSTQTPTEAVAGLDERPGFWKVSPVPESFLAPGRAPLILPFPSCPPADHSHHRADSTHSPSGWHDLLRIIHNFTGFFGNLETSPK